MQLNDEPAALHEPHTMLSTHAALLLAAACGPDAPPVWPRRFTLVQRRVPDASASVSLATTVTFYDADRGANLIQITPDANASDVVWDLELDSRLSYYFTPSTGQCKEIAMPVGVLRPTWLSNATFLGRKRVNGRDCLAYTKADFIDYYADATTCEPVSWYFHTMRARFDSVFWAPGLAVPNASWLAPPRYCREEASPEPVAAAGAAERESGGLPTARRATFAPVRDDEDILSEIPYAGTVAPTAQPTAEPSCAGAFASPLSLWSSTQWVARGFTNISADLNLAALRDAIGEMSAKYGDLGVAATVFDGQGRQIFQETVGSKHCQGPWGAIGPSCSNSTFADGFTDGTELAVYSNSKLTAAITVLAAVVDTGLGYLDEPLSVSLPAYFSTSSLGDVTPRQILSHTSGITNVFYTVGDPDPKYFPVAAQCINGTLDSCVRTIAAGGAEHLPAGSQFAYTDWSFEVLAALVRAKTGLSFGAAFAKHVAGPLGLVRTTYACPLVGSTAEHAHPAYGLCSTAAEFPRIVQMLGGGGVGADGARVLSARSAHEIMSPQTGAAKLNDPIPAHSFLNTAFFGHGRCRGYAGGSVPGSSLVGYGLGAFQAAGGKSEAYLHPSNMGPTWVVVPGLYSAYIAAQYPIAQMLSATLRVIDEFDQKSTFRMSAPTSGCVMALEACGSGGLFRAVPPLPEPLPMPAPLF